MSSNGLDITFVPSRSLPPMKLSAEDFQQLTELIEAEVGKQLTPVSRPSMVIEYRTRGRKARHYSARSAAAFAVAQDLPAVLNGMQMLCSSTGLVGFRPSVEINSGYWGARLTVRGVDEAWCEGTASVIWDFAWNHRAWYSSVREWTWSPFIIVALFFALALFAAANSPSLKPASGLIFLIDAVLIIVSEWIVLRWNDIFPSFALVRKKTPQWNWFLVATWIGAIAAAIVALEGMLGHK